MTNDEIKILSNMMLLLPKIKEKDSYSEEDYFYLYQLTCGYHELRDYFENKEIIQKILTKKYKNIELHDLLKVARNRYGHVDKNDGIEELVILQSRVKKEVIHKLINEIKKGMNNIYENKLKNNDYKLLINTKPIINLFESIKININDKESKNKFDKYCKERIKKIFEKFDYSNSTIDEFELIREEIINMYKEDIIKNGLIQYYGIDIYNEIIRMIMDETFSTEQAQKLVDLIKNKK